MKFIKECVIRATPEKVFAFHELPDAINRLTPPWEKSKIIQAAQSLQVGSRAIIESKIFGIIPARWVAEHTAYDPPEMFEDTQIKGPFKSWRHRHIIEPNAEGAVLRDEIKYEPPLGFLGKLFSPYIIEPRLKKLFAYRHQVTKEWCESNENK
jgi:ligand-binding SRPBCC domain-containing protein